MANNQKQWSSATPGLLIILIDQSGSMMQPYADGDTRTEFSAKVINRMINTIIKKSFYKDKPKNRCFITVIGYGYEIKVLCSGFLEELYKKPLRIEKREQQISDGNGGLVSKTVNQPIWVEPIDKDTWTNMRDAFKSAKQLASDWIADKPNCPAPVIINISDGMPYYDHQSEDICMRETAEIAKEVMALSNDDGNVLVFNVEIGDGGHKIVTPSSESEVAEAGAPAQFLYEISSEIPEGYKSAALKNGLSTKEGARGCIFNADGVDLIKFIDFGSSQGQRDNNK